MASAPDVSATGLPISFAQGATGRTSAGFLASGQVAKQYVGQITLSGVTQTITLETVTAGRTYIITDIIVTTTSSTQIEFRVQAAGADIFRAHVTSSKGIEAPGLETQPNAAAGQVVTLVVPSGTGAVDYNIFGIEQ